MLKQLIYPEIIRSLITVLRYIQILLENMFEA